ncbi:hypothetical protein A374_09144 [Fictibacillus macauensis ZFHKF-1]|uniref:DUF2642 domain-containing protein n=1 Tax=Fictibacillus macauensis ZFHKF-1 TaxID=1196324 RepID=I8UGJ6_9BACL|nr:DUF2642 domain-containing protein [Fictibacillus macauensis]EIT85990.1 hypothetical protein A374_09144 [Fictibacillus macauensis ZFHKF-1]
MGFGYDGAGWGRRRNAFSREACALLNERVQVDTVNQSYRGRLVEVCQDTLVLRVRRNDCTFRVIIRIEEIVAIFPI